MQTGMERQMTFSSLEARQFLIDKITAQANRTATPLTEGERRMLALNLKVPESAAGIPVELLQDKSHAYENKIVRLLRGAYERDRGHSQERQKYKEAVRALEKGSDYILIIAAEVVLVRDRVSNTVLYLMIAIVVVLMVLGLHYWTK
jgi:hypothetical protein